MKRYIKNPKCKTCGMCRLITATFNNVENLEPSEYYWQCDIDYCDKMVGSEGPTLSKDEAEKMQVENRLEIRNRMDKGEPLDTKIIESYNYLLQEIKETM